MVKLFTAIGFAALTAYAYAQYTSWSLFDNVASAQPSSRLAGAGRSYHK